MTPYRLLACLALAALCPAQPPKPPIYEIRGVVIDHLTHQPIRKALVRLTPITGPGQLTSLTAEDGRFGFVNIPRGKYRLMAQRRGYSEHAFHENGQYSTAIAVGPGLDATKIVFPLQAPGSINGTVVDEDAAPMPGASVLLYREIVDEGEKRITQVGNTSTDSAGTFHLGQLSAGTYFLAVENSMPQPDATMTYPLTYSGDTNDGSAAQPILVGEGQSAQIHMALHPLPNIHIPVGDGTGKPVAIPQLLVRGPGNSPILVGMSFSNGQKTEITGLPAGHYLARVFTRRHNLDIQPAAQEVDVADGVPLPAPSATGAPGISGTLKLEGGARPAHLNVLFVDKDNNASFGIRVGQDGTLDASSSPTTPGSYAVALATDQYYIKSIVVQGAEFVSDHIELTENCHAKLSIVAAPASSLSSLDGFAMRNRGPIAAAMVLLVPQDPNRAPLYRRDQTDSDGSFTLSNILPGEYTLLAIDDEGRDLVYKDPAVIRPYLAAGQRITFPRTGAAPVQITVQPRLP